MNHSTTLFALNITGLHFVLKPYSAALTMKSAPSVRTTLIYSDIHYSIPSWRHKRVRLYFNTSRWVKVLDLPRHFGEFRFEDHFCLHHQCMMDQLIEDYVHLHHQRIIKFTVSKTISVSIVGEWLRPTTFGDGLFLHNFFVTSGPNWWCSLSRN
jgi:hypothetical protein